MSIFRYSLRETLVQTSITPSNDGSKVEADFSLMDKDIALWYTIGTPNFCVSKDCPVMSCDYVGLLKPTGFFEANPALDVPSPSDCLWMKNRRLP